ncbi:MAG: hypothetical protein LBO09_07780 [Candidatus Peribacteria bacterium]|nr:hypothetical protein [Candidatus Peribacteria bacterium]
MYYTAQDSNGNKALTGERTVIVQKTLIPITPPITSGGGGGKSLAKDNCPDGDFSSSYYDNTCDSSPLRGGEVNQEHNVAEEKSLYKTAYEWGNDYGITTVSIYEEARISDAILRQEMAKMISTYAIKLLNKTPDPDKVACAQFQDVSEVPTELQPYIIQSCELGLMGMDGDGVGIQENFFPKNSITRAEVGTILSRLLRGTTYATQEGDETYYTRHLQALKKAGIMNFISNPEMLELRGNILLMLWKSVT